MELLQLKYFCDAAKSQNFSKTARKFIVPPSNISQSIKRLEAELSTSLFTRRANSIILNEHGEKFFEKISKAMELIDEASYELRDDGSSGTISISINNNRRIVMDAIEKFKKLYPEVNIKTAYFGNADAEEYNIIIDGENDALTGYRREIFLSEEIALAVNSESPLAKLEHIDIKSLKNQAFITMDNKASLYKVTKAICAAYGFEPRIALQSDDPHFIRKCVQLGLGVAFAPTLSWQGQFPENVVLKSLNYKRDTYVYINEKVHFPLCAQNFLDMLLSESKKFI